MLTTNIPAILIWFVANNLFYELELWNTLYYVNIFFIVYLWSAFIIKAEKKIAGKINLEENSIKKVDKKKLILMMGFTGILSVVIGQYTGAFGRRGEIEFINFNESIYSFLYSLINPILCIVSSFFWAKFIFSNKYIWGILAGIISSLVFGLTATRWQFLLSISPIIIILIQSISLKILLPSLAVLYLGSIPLAALRMGRDVDPLAFDDFTMQQIPIVNTAYAIKEVGVHPEGLESFKNGVLKYYIPRFLYKDKGVDEAMRTFNKKRIGIDILTDSGNTLPGLVGSLYIYGGTWFIVLWAFIFGIITRILDKKINIIATPFELLVLSLFLIGLVLQVRNISLGYLTPAMFCWLAIIVIKIFKVPNKKRILIWRD